MLESSESDYAKALLSACSFWREIPAFQNSPQQLEELASVSAFPALATGSLVEAMNAAEWNVGTVQKYILGLEHRRELVFSILQDGQVRAVRYLREQPVTTQLQVFATLHPGQGDWRGTLAWYLTHLSQAESARFITFATSPDNHRMISVGEKSGFNLNPQKTAADNRGGLWYQARVGELAERSEIVLPETRRPLSTGQAAPFNGLTLKVDYYGPNPFFHRAVQILEREGREALLTLAAATQSSRLEDFVPAK